jgi:TonB family protein
MKILSTFLLCFTFAFSLFGKGDLITIRLIDPVQEIYLEDVEIYTAQNHVLIGKTNESGNFSIGENYLNINLEFVKKGYKTRNSAFSSKSKDVEISLEMLDETKTVFENSMKFVPTDSMTDVVQFPDKEAYFKDTTKREISMFIMKNLRYPEYALEHDIMGKVYMKFVVEKDGTVSNVQVVRGVSACLDKESIKVVSLFPKWIPGEKDGVPVRSFFMLPINYYVE